MKHIAVGKTWLEMFSYLETERCIKHFVNVFMAVSGRLGQLRSFGNVRREYIALHATA